MTISEQKAATAAEKLTERLAALGLKHELFGNESQLLQWFISRCNIAEFTTFSLLDLARETANIYGDWNELLKAVAILKHKQLLIMFQEGEKIKVKLHIKLANI
jgi:hypothetical protein